MLSLSAEDPGELLRQCTLRVKAKKYCWWRSRISSAALIVAKKLTLIDVAGVIHPHPTLSESFTLLAMTMLMGAGT